ncbi:MAG: right-handed parallel beta-helix repeat-containing protein [Myxococcota bacterium]|nr:right-handed parallel beta-helix repeat-containing protein [Myxococcota bacterium]
MRMRQLLGVLTALTLGLGAAAGAGAAEGRIEINQAVVDAAGGFPFLIIEPGSYVLTGDIVVPGDTTAIELRASGIDLDLNGFAISGPAVCFIGCPTGASSGVMRPALFPLLQGGSLTRIHGGRIQGFTGDCVQLADNSQVENVIVSNCGGSGIVLRNGGRAQGNTIGPVGEAGLRFEGTGNVFAHNVLTLVRENGAGDAVEGMAKETAGNSCPDSSCGGSRLPRFYLESSDPNKADGSEARSVCAPGFHMASFWEIRDPTALRYDHTLGRSQAVPDPAGPPVPDAGWVRTGGDSNPGTLPGAIPGQANCNGYTSNALEHRGTRVSLHDDWTAAPAFPSNILPWVPTLSPCSFNNPVWCVED